MSKQKVVSSLLLSTVVLGGLAFYPTTTVKAESLETDVTSVSSGDVVEKPVVSDGGESDFLAEEELEDDETLEEELNEKAEEVTEPSSPEALLQPRAVMSNSGSNDMEEIPVNDEPSDNMAEKVVKQQSELIQSSNADYKNAGDQSKLSKSVSVDLLSAERGQVTWKVSFDTSAWSFNHNGGLYFVLPNGLKLTAIIDNNYEKANIIDKFPTNVNTSENNGGQKYRFFSKKENGQGDKNFDSQWGWSVDQAAPNEKVKNWKTENRFSEIYFIDKIQATTQLTYTLTASVTDPSQKTFPLVAVMKSFRYGNSSGTEVTSLGAREITLEKETPMPPKETPKPEEPLVPKEEPKQEIPEVPQEQPKETPQESPTPGETQLEEPKKEDAPAPEVPSVPEEKPKEDSKPEVPSAPEAPSTPKEESPKEEVPQTPQEPKEQPKEIPQESPTPGETQPEEPKKEEEPGQELPKPMEPKVDKPTPEVPEAPKEEPKQDTPQTPQVPSTPKEEAPKEEVPAPEVPSVPEEQPKETPTPEVPKQEDVQPEAPKS
ncbi:TPA: cell surface protein, partial [Streptococcus suis]|nr:cell surface protein [Streptococcus suis]HEM3622219.1 cell surface protein [Streptococcus suis]HEM3627610.1 cell surface protein [Streptococcus suis]HEM3631090.1 cell surface protein [Streptococcus suis]HEM3640728.1 cell surface protein [Streptococcus suis]